MQTQHTVDDLLAASSFGERLVIARQLAGFDNRNHFCRALNSLLEKPHKTGIAYSTVILWEQGKTLPSLDYFTGIVRLLGISADMLLGTAKRSPEEQKAELEEKSLTEFVALMRVVMQVQRETLERLENLERQIAGKPSSRPKTLRKRT